MIVISQIIGTGLIVVGTIMVATASYFAHMGSKATIETLEYKQSLDWHLETVLSEINNGEFIYTSFTALKQQLDANELTKKNFWNLYEVYTLSRNQKSNVAIYMANFTWKLKQYPQYYKNAPEVYTDLHGK